VKAAVLSGVTTAAVGRRRGVLAASRPMESRNLAGRREIAGRRLIGRRVARRGLLSIAPQDPHLIVRQARREIVPQEPAASTGRDSIGQRSISLDSGVRAQIVRVLIGRAHSVRDRMAAPVVRRSVRGQKALRGALIGPLPPVELAAKAGQALLRVPRSGHGLRVRVQADRASTGRDLVGPVLVGPVLIGPVLIGLVPIGLAAFGPIPREAAQVARHSGHGLKVVGVVSNVHLIGLQAQGRRAMTSLHPARDSTGQRGPDLIPDRRKVLAQGQRVDSIKSHSTRLRETTGRKDPPRTGAKAPAQTSAKARPRAGTRRQPVRRQGLRAHDQHSMAEAREGFPDRAGQRDLVVASPAGF